MKNTLIFLFISSFAFGQSTGPIVKPSDRTNETWTNCDTLIVKDTVTIDTIYFSTVSSDTVITINYRYSHKSDREIDTLQSTSKEAYLDSLIQILDAKILELEYLADYHYILFLVSKTQLKNYVRFKEEYENLY